jgi:tRNA-uridine 2-sulfurtransferase
MTANDNGSPNGSPNRVMVAMSGGVDSSVAAALLVDAGYEVVGVTLRLWGGDSDSGCCSVADVDDARRVAQQLDIDHHVFNLADDFDRHVVGPYVADHAAGRTPNPCIECNRHLKFDRLVHRATALGFSLVATGHHARLGRDAAGRAVLRRGADPAKDQSYVLHMLSSPVLDGLMFPVGELTKDEVRRIAAGLGLRTADKPDSQDVCFITAARGRQDFLERRIELHEGRLVDTDGTEVGSVSAVELVTVGQRRGLALAGHGGHRYALAVDVAARTVTVGSLEDLLVATTSCTGVRWVNPDVLDGAPAGEVLVQCSAHGAPVLARVVRTGTDPSGGELARVEWSQPVRRIAPGQSVVFYDGDTVLGGGTAMAEGSGDR